MDDLFLEGVEHQVLDFATGLRAKWEKEHKLYSVIFELTPRCNFACVHCYLNHNHAESELSYEEIIRIIDILYAHDVLFLTFTGGDVFTRKDFLDIYTYAKKKGFIVEIYTNGALINEKALRVFEQYPPLLIDISLYGSCEETYRRVTGVAGAFSKVLANIQALLDKHVRVSVKAPVLNLYFDELPKIKAIAQRFGIPFRTGFEIFPTIDNDDSVQQYCVPIEKALQYEFDEFLLHPRTFGEEEDIELVNLQKEKPLFRCKLGRTSCAIDYEGRLCPCMSFRHAGEKITEENFTTVWQSFSEYPKMRASDDYKCLSCEAYDFCDICPAMMQFVHGDLEYVDTHFCRTAKARFDHYKKGKPIEDIFPIKPYSAGQ